MKSSYLIRLMSLIIAVAILAGCSKDKQLVPNAANTNEVMVKARPIPTGGFLTGYLAPVPLSASIKVYNDNFSKEYIPGVDGAFKIVNLPPDSYNLWIRYVVQNGESTRSYYLEIFSVPVKENEVTELGIIILPEIYR